MNELPENYAVSIDPNTPDEEHHEKFVCYILYVHGVIVQKYYAEGWGNTRQEALEDAIKEFWKL